jgi:hypothetical protein
MQEVRKVLTGEKIIQEETPKKEKDEWLTVCLTQANDRVVPVYVPGFGTISIGDLVFFNYGGESYTSTALMTSNTTLNSAMWKKLIEVNGMVPVRAKKYGYVSECKWEDET